ncbi:MAG: 2-oxoacid:ferredoxin oxidoreductase subunit beta [SAR202 cluster bacterium]|jgi:2-oxoglutarate ferredoxin oxidoreductase subunit beta|nr:2-oxoacid ferredoxin oxidoreductase [Chloroflexota bacterium]MDP6421583.1 thiamine pyrophosphate-dependent enzyme [SAR202 cluster bacterium]HAL46868.1 2-oxoacid ferredoxin oxidoreductase [Dehalococcoidia bacterium]MDP6664640.1 thiamine pyrophosphate-dependent enzyme [SAR202 cluster bacterium]MDP6798499.1 thiamine pyrophosphate-dependent enzyme [SAR202 cluster bacterium]|tara:strand:+ start:6089 stop:6955 length:867 start_codon:yes stop_codon:yes gene_type:complete
MTSKNPEYDFKWCPGCGDFGVRRALEGAISRRAIEDERPPENNVVIAGIGCSGNMVHMLEGDQPYGFHGIHGRTLPVAMGVKSANPELNVVVVAGDGDFLGIGQEHIGPQAARNLNITAIVMDNGVYGLTKGQSSPTTNMGVITSSTPYGKTEEKVRPFQMYLTMGVSFVASTMSSQVRQMSTLMSEAMNHPGFAIVHVQSPCTEYNNTFEALKGNAKKGIAPLAYDIPEEHDEANFQAAAELAADARVPLGVLYRDASRPTLDQKIDEINAKAKEKTAASLLDALSI